jgi:uncharacterized protein YjcR
VPWQLGLMAANMAPRCTARAKSTGQRCRMPAVKGKRVCRLHGGAKGSGAPRGNRNALKHGQYTTEAIMERRGINDLIRQFRNELGEFQKMDFDGIED